MRDNTCSEIQRVNYTFDAGIMGTGTLWCVYTDRSIDIVTQRELLMPIEQTGMFWKRPWEHLELEND